MLAWLGGLGISNYNGLVSPAYAVFKPTRAICERYYHYLYRSQLYLDEFARKSTGVVPSRWRMYENDFGNVWSLMPPIEEQKQIAMFLDKKCTEIDKVIKCKEEIIELLNERLQIIIQRIINEGINPKTELIRYKINGINQIPKQWKVRRLKHICDVNPRLRNYKIIDTNQLIAFLPMEKISEKGIIDSESLVQYKIVHEGFTCFEKNDVIIAKITPCFENGKGSFLDSLKTNIGFGSTEFHVLRPNKKILGKYLYYITMTKHFREMGEALMTGSAGQKRVPSNFVENYIIGIPPTVTEQKKIVEYLERIDKSTIKVIHLKKQEIELLKEYKHSLINDAVTGKIKIINNEK